MKNHYDRTMMVFRRFIIQVASMCAFLLNCKEHILVMFLFIFRLFRSYGLWLEETRLNKMKNMQHIEFPPQYDSNRLTLIMSGNEVL